MSKLKSYTNYDKIVSLILPLTPILDFYGWDPFDISFIIVILLYIWGLLYRRPTKNVPRFLKIYLLYYLISFIIGGIISRTMIPPLGWLKVSIIYLLFFHYTQIELFKKYYFIITYISIIFLFFQIFTYEISNIKISGIISFLPIIPSMSNSEYIALTLKENWRFCSFFSEPAKFAQYLLPFYSILLFSKTENNRIIKLSLVILTLLFLESGNAILILCIVTIIYLLFSLFKNFDIKRIIFIVSISTIIGIGGIYYMKTNAASNLIERQNELSGEEYASSGFVRIYRGYYVFEALPIIEKIFGANNITLLSQANSHSSVSFLFGDNDYYYNTFQSIIIKTGLIGLTIFTIFIYRLFRYTNIIGKSVLITFISLCFIASMYLSYLMLMYLVFIWNNKKK